SLVLQLQEVFGLGEQTDAERRGEEAVARQWAALSLPPPSSDDPELASTMEADEPAPLRPGETLASPGSSARAATAVSALAGGGPGAGEDRVATAGAVSLPASS